MIVHLLYRACRLLSLAGCQRTNGFNLNHPAAPYPCLVPTPQSTLCTVHASTNRRDAGPRSTPGGPQIPNVFVITLAMICLYLLQDSYFPPIYRIFFRGAWNLHEWSARSRWSLGQLSVMSRRDNASVGDAMQRFQILGRAN